MANNAILFRQEHIAPIKQAVKDKFPITYQGKTYNSWSEWVAFTKEDFRPIRIRDDDTGRRYVLPLAVRDNPSFSKLKEVIQEAVIGVTLTQIVKADLPEYNIGGATDYTKP